MSFSESTAMDIDDASDQLAASTPPTSVGDDSSITHENAFSGGRAKRTRVSVNYNVKELLDAQASQEVIRATASSKPRKASALSGRTLVDHRNEAPPDELENEDIRMQLDDDFSKITARSPESKSIVKPKQAERRPSIVGRAKKAVSSVLGKRSLGAYYEAGKKKLGMMDEPEVPKKSKLLRELDTGRGGILDELDLDTVPDPQPPPAKRARTSTKTAKVETTAPVKAATKVIASAPVIGPEMYKTSTGVHVRKYHDAGLYVGQQRDFDPVTKPAKTGKLQKKNLTETSDSTGEDGAPPKKHLNIGLPMYNKLESDRYFTLPYDIYGPTSDKKMLEKPTKWTNITKNKPIGDAKKYWKQPILDPSYCTCNPETGCDEHCWNAIMRYECDKSNCKLGEEKCGNRPFLELDVRSKRGSKKKGTPYDHGVEVVKTQERGHGIRATRGFAAGKIIMEYTGEIITEDECQRRMEHDYMDAPCYYVMEMENGLILDGMKGGIARFINHSCDPNCEVKMTKVGQYLRIGVYAGKEGISTGEELSYDYNFQVFNEQSKQACYCGGKTCRGYLGKRFTEMEMKKFDVEKQKQLHKMKEEAEQRAQIEALKKQIQIDRGSGWTGYVMVEDVKEELLEQARKKKEAEEKSERAIRMQKRRGREAPVAAPPAAVTTSQPRKKAVPRRKKSDSEEETPRPTTIPPAEDEDESDEELKVEVIKNISRITKETTVTQSAAPQQTEDDTALEIVVSAKPQRSQSMRDRVKQAISSVGSGGMRTLKQSTLNFAKRA